ncbi:hypothetical protein SSX86_013189 [Deinandra increscens subsp. villosa]|uniref:PAP/OAS1 substrate-binding-related domain-containing protein n=1 Tax=Deinandra increscens subsp. villosa TaxID=3103831 RepID=A0AAP0GZH7_9ASTR
MGDLGMDEDRPFLPSFAEPLRNPDPNSIRVETWVLAEDPAREVLYCVHPTLDSEDKRKDVIEYVQKLIRCNLQLEVFPYGSVPLKTYLPDGDIDLTVLSTPNLDDLLPSEVLCVLQAEEKNGNAEFEVKETQFIDAEVKLVKCLVQDIVIDISFNQLGGLCTLCFLEQVDRLAGKDHLFKRSVILIKAWCYYESRILGAHHGLISTYALETLVLYIFHVFHASLNGPLEVLYRFLDYYAKFDWDNYCLSLDGPVCKSSTSNSVVETLDNKGKEVLLGAEFRKNCMDMFIVPSKGSETDLRAFNLKNLNIIDPLKENNNLGRSVHTGNYFRIRTAFRYGARKLGKILQQSNNSIKDEIKVFFKNTLKRLKPNYGSDPTFIFADNGFGTLSISSQSDAYYEDDSCSRFSNGDFDEYMDDHNTLLLTESNLEKGPESVVEKTALELWMERGGSELVDGDTVCLCANKDNSSDNLSDAKEKDGIDDNIGETEILNMFPDLAGDYDAHIRSLLYGQGCHGYAMCASMVRNSPSPPTSPYGNKNPRDMAAAADSWPVPFQQNLAPQVNANGALMGHPKHINRSNGNMGNIALRRTRPSIPAMSSNTCEDGQPPTRGRGRGRGPSNGRHLHRAQVGSREPQLAVEPNHASQSPRQALVYSSLSNQIHQHASQVNSTANGFANQPRKLEFGSFRSMPKNPSNEQSLKVDAYGRKQASALVCWCFFSVFRFIENSLHLKNEDEFPPLSA